MNARSLKFRLVVWHAGWVTILFIVFGIFVYTSLKNHLQEAQRQALARRARQVVELVQRTPMDSATLGGSLKATFASEANNRFTRVTINGEVRHVSGRPTDASFDPASVPPSDRIANDEVLELRTLPYGQPPLYIVMISREAEGRRILVEEGTSSGGVRAALHGWLAALLTGLLVLIFGAAAGGFVLVQRALSPVDEIIRSAERITLRNRNERLPVVHSRDELERLSLALNGMIARLDDSFQQTQRFLADASHELRTPLTIIHAELEQLAGTAEDTATARAAASALEETQRLRKIVEALFTLSRFDAGEAVRESVPVNIGDLVAGTTEQMQLLADDKELQLVCECEERAIVRGDSARLKQVVVNLLHNAIKYTPPGGHINVRVRRRDDTVIIIVADTGIGIPDGAIPHVFDRFYRVDKARSRDEGGAGLGLSIVKAICTAHHGTVRLTSREGAGSEFTVEFPLDGDAASAHARAA